MRLRRAIKENELLNRLVYRPWRFVADRTVQRGQYLARQRDWQRRIDEVVACPDNAFLERVSDAGVVHGGVQVMHNGLKIAAGSYYGDDLLRLLEANRGVHEPQEERVFAEVLAHMPRQGGATMIELGAYWGFYSMWFHREVPGARCILVEPERANLKMGQRNFALNGMRGEFIQAFVGAAPATDGKGRRTVCVDELVDGRSLSRVHILHSDIQGFEMDMLDGARRTLAAGLVDYVFISTHASDLHERCLRRLKEHGFTIIADADMENTYSYDGLIAARRADLPGAAPISISSKRTPGAGAQGAARG